MPRSAIRFACLSVCLVCAAPHTSWAHGISDEITLGRAGGGPFSTSRPFVSDRLIGTADASQWFTLRLEGTYSRYPQTATTSTAEVVALGLGVAVYPNDHWSFGVDGARSFPSTTLSWVPVSYDFRDPRSPTSAQPVSGNARLNGQFGSYGAALFAGYDTAGESNWETTVDLSASLTSYSDEQRVVSIPGPFGRIANPRTSDVCGADACSPQIVRIFRKESSRLTQLRTTLGITETMFRDTDATLAFSFYVYDDDPAQAGYYTVPLFGRGLLGDGLPVLPLRFSIRPSATQRWGALSVTASAQYGKYVADLGYQGLGTLKIQYKLTRALKAWVASSFQRDSDIGSGPFATYTASVGARVSF